MITSRIRNTLKSAALTVLLLVTTTPAALAQDASTDVAQTWQMLDYLATDYSGAVQDGAISNAAEYAEMSEFAATARTRIKALASTPDSASLLSQSDALIAAIAAKAKPAEVAAIAHGLADGLLKNYPVTTAPANAPDLTRGAVLYQSQCASCHGASGRGDGIAGAQLSPPPIDFTDQERADTRSVLSLFQVLTQGVEGTAMVSYADSMSLDDRWSVAFYTGTLAYPQRAAGSGSGAWQSDTDARARLTSLEDLARARVTDFVPEWDVERSRSIIGFLRAQPAALEQALSGLPLARGRLAASLSAYREGDVDGATTLALSAYLDGVEPVEPLLSARDSALRAQLETAMGAYRSALSSQSDIAAMTQQAAQIDALLQRAEVVVADRTNNATSTFFGAFTILVREGLEALLVVVALLAFLRKAGRTEAVRYLHSGWVAALLAGGLTWAVATYFISINGANRELTEGFSSLFAAAVLLSVGLWMHQKSIGGLWQAYLKQKMTAALNRRSAWFLFGLSFISVYREVFETILFYAAMWTEGQKMWVLAGIGSGSVALALIAWIMLRTSRRLPIAKFFSASSMLMAILVVVLTGKGIAALQEAGWIGVSLAPTPSLEWLGMHPTWQTALAQLAVALVLLAGFALNIRRGRTSAPLIARTAD